MVIESWSSELVVFPYQRRSFVGGSWTSGTWNYNPGSGTQVTSNHFPLDTERDSGGAWLMSKIVTQHLGAPLNTPLWVGQVGLGNPVTTFSEFTPSVQLTDAALRAKGTTAVSRCSPNNPSFSIPQAIGEAREGLPSIIGSGLLKKRAQIAREAGSEYLNIEFAWKPLVSDLRSLATAVNDSHEIWTNYRKGSGFKTRKGYHFPKIEDSKEYRGNFNPLPSAFPHGFLTGSSVSYKTNETWFSGAFKYAIPEPVGFSDKMQYWQSQASKILGVRLTPDTVWNLNPWTWAADWFANTGDLMTNVSNMGVDGLVLQYGYAMDQENIDIQATASGTATILGQSYPFGATRKQQLKRCKRVPTQSPYGFGATWASLSTRQLAICAALGLSAT
jgi:hypothetical protein